MTYTVVLMREKDGRYAVSVPALKGCYTQGDTIAEALQMAEKAIGLFVEVMVEDGKPLPEDRPDIRLNMRNSAEAIVCRVNVREAAKVA